MTSCPVAGDGTAELREAIALVDSVIVMHSGLLSPEGRSVAVVAI